MENTEQFIETEYTNGNRQIMHVPTSWTYQAFGDELNSVGNNNKYIVLENIGSDTEDFYTESDTGSSIVSFL